MPTLDCGCVGEEVDWKQKFGLLDGMQGKYLVAEYMMLQLATRRFVYSMMVVHSMADVRFTHLQQLVFTCCVVTTLYDILCLQSCLCVLGMHNFL